MKYRRLRNSLGFTIVEFMTVTFIIAGLAAMIIPNIHRAVHKAKFTACISNLKNMGSVLEQYRNENEEYPETLTHLVPSYLESIPYCPGANGDTYTKGYEVSDDRSRFTLSCNGSNHKELGLGENEPHLNTEGELIYHGLTVAK